MFCLIGFLAGRVGEKKGNRGEKMNFCAKRAAKQAKGSLAQKEGRKEEEQKRGRKRNGILFLLLLPPTITNPDQLKLLVLSLSRNVFSCCYRQNMMPDGT